MQAETKDLFLLPYQCLCDVLLEERCSTQYLIRVLVKLFVQHLFFIYSLSVSARRLRPKTITYSAPKDDCVDCAQRRLHILRYEQVVNINLDNCQ